MQHFGTQPQTEQHRKKGFCNNNGDYAHAPADGQLVQDRLNKSENNQAVILCLHRTALISVWLEKV